MLFVLSWDCVNSWVAIFFVKQIYFYEKPGNVLINW